PDAAGVGVGDEQIAHSIYRETSRGPQLGGSGGPAVSTEAFVSSARQRVDHALRSDNADAVVSGIGDEQIARSIYCDTGRIPQPGSSGGPSISTEAWV